MPKRPRGEAPSRPVHPHDALVKWAFKQVPHAQGLLRAVLSPEEMAAVNLATLRVEDGDHVDAELSHLYSDLALSAEMFGERVYFYALVEQQRKQEERISSWCRRRRGPHCCRTSRTFGSVWWT
jgi:predicted transposase YdaD